MKAVINLLKQLSKLKNPTQKIIKFLGKDYHKPKVPLSKTDVTRLNFAQQEQLKLLQQEGVDLSKFSVRDLNTMMAKRKKILQQQRGRHTIIERDPEYQGYDLHDIQDGKIVGETGFVIDKPGLTFAMTTNVSPRLPNGRPAVHGVQERAINVGTQIAKQNGINGVISGQELLDPAATTRLYPKYGLTPDKAISHNGTRMWSWDRMELGQPVYRITEPTYQVPAKSTAFSPSILDIFGKMRINWSDPNIYKAISIPIMGYGLYQLPNYLIQNYES